MARAIDSEVVYQFLTEQLVKETGTFSKGVNKGLNIARSAMRNTDAIPTLTQPNAWVSVEEKTPKGNASILIYENGDIAIAAFKDEKFMEFSDTGYPVLIRRPTHWMPLPRAPKED